MASARKEGNVDQRLRWLAPSAAPGFSGHLPASELLAGKSSQPGLNGTRLTPDDFVKNRLVRYFTVKHRKTRFSTQYTWIHKPFTALTSSNLNQPYLIL